ncbi:MAG TPA: hypothetical protein VNO50_07820 [Pyrinomonadaceae bacterium]|nr:hypothetical protein [Pyrinomonadaceae bacterium]
MFIRTLLSHSLLLLSLPIIQSGALANGNANQKAKRAVKPEPCVVGRTAPPAGFWTWPPHTRVNIYLREPDFSKVDVAAVKLALESWDATATENGSDVRFSFQGLTRETKNARREITIVRSKVFNQKQRHRALLEAHSINGDRFIDYALILVDPSVQDQGLLTNVIAHEIGHSLGLLDCPQCSSRSTAMGLLKAGNESNGIQGPTACDSREVTAVYRALKPRLLVAVVE